MLISFIVSLTSHFISTILKSTLIIISSSIFIADLFCIYQYRTLINYGMLEIILATNPNETEEFIEMYVFQTFTLILLLIILAVSVILFKLFNKFIINKLKFVIIVMAISTIVSISSAIKNIESFAASSSSIGRIIVMIPRVYNNLQSYKEVLQSASHDVKLTKDESNIPILVFILGESTGRNHMQIYGYKLPTTPHLAERQSKDELYMFNDVISPHSHTMPVLEKLFTFYRSDSSDKWFNYTNLFDILKAANYHTEWLSNQESSGLYLSASKLYSERCDVKKFTAIRDTLDDKNYDLFYSDELLLPLFDDSLSNPYDKNFYVLHLMGTHGNYKRRYPANFNKFTAADEEGADENIKQTRAEYDNAVLFNDYIINEIINRLENKNAVIIYISDHGEDVYDERNFTGHMESEGSRFMIEIPMIIWTSQQFKNAYPELLQKFAKAKDKPFMTDDMIHMILDMMNIETKDFDPTKSLINDDYDTARKRIYSGHIYDKEQGLQCNEKY